MSPRSAAAIWCERRFFVLARRCCLPGAQAERRQQHIEYPPDRIVALILERDPDPNPERWSKQGRQFTVINAKAEYAAHTGPKATPWAGHKVGKHCTAQGNILAGEGVVNSMVEAFENTTGHLYG